MTQKITILSNPKNGRDSAVMGDRNTIESISSLNLLEAAEMAFEEVLRLLFKDGFSMVPGSDFVGDHVQSVEMIRTV